MESEQDFVFNVSSGLNRDLPGASRQRCALVALPSWAEVYASKNTFARVTLPCSLNGMVWSSNILPGQPHLQDMLRILSSKLVPAMLKVQSKPEATLCAQQSLLYLITHFALEAAQGSIVQIILQQPCSKAAVSSSSVSSLFLYPSQHWQSRATKSVSTSVAASMLLHLSTTGMEKEIDVFSPL